MEKILYAKPFKSSQGEHYGIYGRVIEEDEKFITIENEVDGEVYKQPREDFKSLKFLDHNTLLECLQSSRELRGTVFTKLGIVRFFLEVNNHSWEDKVGVNIDVKITPRGAWYEGITLKSKWNSVEGLTQSDIGIRVEGNDKFITHCLNAVAVLTKFRGELTGDVYKKLEILNKEVQEEFRIRSEKANEEKKAEFLKHHRLVEESPKRWLANFEREARENNGVAKRTLYTWNSLYMTPMVACLESYFTEKGLLRFTRQGAPIKKHKIISNFPDVYEERED